MSTPDSFGRLSWGLIKIDGDLVYYEQLADGWWAQELGQAKRHPIGPSVNAHVWNAVVEDHVRNGHQNPSDGVEAPEFGRDVG